MYEYKKPSGKYIQFVDSTGSHYEHSLETGDQLIIFQWGFEGYPDRAVILFCEEGGFAKISSNVPLKSKQSKTTPNYIEYYFTDSDV